jgi:hypothetical protein
MPPAAPVTRIFSIVPLVNAVVILVAKAT